MEELLFIKVFFFGVGVYVVISSFLKLEIFPEDSRSQPKIGRFGRNIVRIFYALIGVSLIINTLTPWF